MNQTLKLRIGIYDHLGWAIAVTASDDHRIVDRRRIELLEQGIPAMPIHHPEPGLSLDQIESLVARVRASAERATVASLDALCASLPGPVTSLHLRAVPASFPTEIALQLRAPYEARADAVMYRQVLAEVAGARAWAVEYFNARTIETDAERILADRAHDVLRGPRDRFGPPWTRDHRSALAATVLAAATRDESRPLPDQHRNDQPR